MRCVPVVHVITQLEFGGAQQNTLYTVSKLDRDLFEPVLVTGPGGYLMREARELDVPLHVAGSLQRRIRPPADLAAFREIRGILRSLPRPPAIVHTHGSKAGILGRHAARRAGVPLIIHSIHGFGFTPDQPPLFRKALIEAERFTARSTDHFIAVSHSNKAAGVGYGFFTPERCSVIRSGFDLDLFRNARSNRDDLTGELAVPHDSPLVLMVACLKPQKAPLDFVGVAHEVHLRRPDAHFILAGDGELRDDLSREIERFGLGKVFHSLGWREDVPRLMKAGDVVILTSRWEGLPRVIPQAKAAGRPVVATAVDGSVEAIVDGVDGYLCPPGDVRALADRLLALLSDPAAARRMGEAGSRSVDEFDRDVMIKKQEDLYIRLLDEKGLVEKGEVPCRRGT